MDTNELVRLLTDERNRIDAAIKLLSGTSTTPTRTTRTIKTAKGKTAKTAPKLPKPKRKTMSAAAKKRIGDAQRKRWADKKKAEKKA